MGDPYSNQAEKRVSLHGADAKSVQGNKLNLRDEFTVLKVQAGNGEPDALSCTDFQNRLFAAQDTLTSFALLFQHRFDQPLLIRAVSGLPFGLHRPEYG